MDDAIGELRSTGNTNVILHFECVLSRSLPSVPLITFDQHHWPFPIWFFDALAMKICNGLKKEQTKNSQC